MDKNREKFLLLRDIHEGNLSRNQDFNLFRAGPARRAHIAHNRLRGLMRELREPGACVTVDTSGEGERVTIRVERMGFSHTATLSDWESEFFFENMGAKTLIPF